MMEKKRSKGITFFGWAFAIAGLLCFLLRTFFAWSFFWNKTLWLKYMRIVTSFRSFGDSETAAQWFWAIDKMLSILTSEFTFTLVFYIVVPLLYFLLLRSGIGILRLQNEWRKAVIGVCIALFMSTFIIDFIFLTGFVMFITIGQVLAKQVLSPNLLAILWSLIFRRFIIELILLSSVVFFFTRPKVKAQFK